VKTSCELINIVVLLSHTSQRKKPIYQLSSPAKASVCQQWLLILWSVSYLQFRPPLHRHLTNILLNDLCTIILSPNHSSKDHDDRDHDDNNHLDNGDDYPCKDSDHSANLQYDDSDGDLIGKTVSSFSIHPASLIFTYSPSNQQYQSHPRLYYASEPPCLGCLYHQTFCLRKFSSFDSDVPTAPTTSPTIPPTHVCFFSYSPDYRPCIANSSTNARPYNTDT